MYPAYGGRGIKLHPRWHDFSVFAKEIPPMPSHDLQLDRINNDKGYVPGNLRWVTHKENTRNSRNCIMVVINGKKKSIAEWLELYGVPRSVYYNRTLRGWTRKEAITVPKQHRYKT